MPLPTIALGILLSTLFAAGFHLVRGGPSKNILILLALSWAGFWLGDFLGWYLGWSFAAIGILNAGMGTIFCFLFMLIGDLMTHIQFTREK